MKTDEVVSSNHKKSIKIAGFFFQLSNCTQPLPIIVFNLIFACYDVTVNIMRLQRMHLSYQLTTKETSTVLLSYSTSSNSSRMCNSGSVMPNRSCTRTKQSTLLFLIKHLQLINFIYLFIFHLQIDQGLGLALPVTLSFSTGRIAG